MAPRIFLVLSGRASPTCLHDAGPDDMVVVGPGVKVVLPRQLHVRKVPLASDEGLRQVTQALAKGLAGAPLGESRNFVESILNDCYAYSIRPAFSTLEFIRGILNEGPVEGIVVIAAKRYGSGVPLVGFSTTESPRGSKELLGAYIAQAISGSFPGIPVEVRSVRGDLFCIDLARKAFMVCANLFFIISFFLKCLIYLSLGRAGPRKVSHGVIVRVPHQARFAARLVSDTNNTAILALPQASQGSLRSFGRMLRQTLAGCAVQPVTTRALFRAISGTFKDIRRLRRFARTPLRVNVGHLDNLLHVDLSDLARELMIFPILVFYKNILTEAISSSQCRALVNFELVGRMAGIEAMVARHAGVPLTTVQTAVVSATPLVVFPWSDEFLVDGPDVARQIAGIGATRYGVVRYAGSALTFQLSRNSNDAMEIGFFTQPYEPEFTIRMLELLCEDARSRGARVYLKLHPRDEERRYREVGANNSDVLTLSSERTDLLLERVDLCVTRTSSVAKEAIATGVPVILCLWTKLDRSVRADYVQPEGELNYYSWDETDLNAIIADYAGLKRAADGLRDRLFGGLGIESLKATLFRDPEVACKGD